MDLQNPRTIARVFGWLFKGMRWWFRSSVGVAAILGLSFVILAPAAVAQDDGGPDGDDHVILTGGLVVPEGETAKTAVVFNGNVLIDGTVSQTLVVFNGRTEITGTVAEDVIVFNGAVVLRSGSRVEGDVVSRQSPGPMPLQNGCAATSSRPASKSKPIAFAAASEKSRCASTG